MGFEPAISAFQRRFVAPLASALFPQEGSAADDHHCFLVRYSAEADVGLDMHEDDSVRAPALGVGSECGDQFEACVWRPPGEVRTPQLHWPLGGASHPRHQSQRRIARRT